MYTRARACLSTVKRLLTVIIEQLGKAGGVTRDSSPEFLFYSRIRSPIDADNAAPVIDGTHEGERSRRRVTRERTSAVYLGNQRAFPEIIERRQSKDSRGENTAHCIIKY